MTQPPRTRGPRSVPVDPDRILDAALEVFADVGLEGGTIRAIAQKAGCDPKLLYYHFPSKEELFLALMRRGIGPVVARLQAIPEDLPTARRLYEVQRTFHDLLEPNPGLRRMVRAEIVRGGSEARGAIALVMRPVLQSVAGITLEGLRRGDLRPGLNPFMAGFFLARMELEILDLVPLMSQHMAGIAADVALPMAEREWFRTYWRGVAARPDEPLPFLDIPTEIPR